MPTAPTPEQSLAVLVLNQTAKHMAPTSLTFLNVLLALTGATVALLISKVDTLASLVFVANLRWGLSLLVISALLGLMARYNASLVQMSVELSSEGEKIGAQLALERPDMDEFDERKFEAEVLRGLFYPARLMVERGFKKTREGDCVAQARVLAKLSQVTGLLVLLQFTCVALGPLIMVMGIKG